MLRLNKIEPGTAYDPKVPLYSLYFPQNTRTELFAFKWVVWIKRHSTSSRLITQRCLKVLYGWPCIVPKLCSAYLHIVFEQWVGDMSHSSFKVPILVLSRSEVEGAFCWFQKTRNSQGSLFYILLVAQNSILKGDKAKLESIFGIENKWSWEVFISRETWEKFYPSLWCCYDVG